MKALDFFCVCPFAVAFLMVYITVEKSRKQFLSGVFVMFMLEAFSAGN